MVNPDVRAKNLLVQSKACGEIDTDLVCKGASR